VRATSFEKPLARETCSSASATCWTSRKPKRALEEASREQMAKYEMIGKAPAIQRVFHEIEKVAPTRR